MQKFINKPENASQELLEGLTLAYPELITLVDGSLVVNKKLSEAERVTVVALGGTGNEPALSGFVGEGMLDVFAAGDIFAAPGPAACLKAVQLADKGQGVLLICANHTGDVLTADIVMKQAEKIGLQIALVKVQDDVSEKRGLVGCVPVCKIAGAAAAAGKTLAEVAEVTQKFADNMATIAVSASSMTNSVAGTEAVPVAAGSMIVGTGIHGEAGGEVLTQKTADETAALLLDVLLTELDVKAGERLLVIVSGSGNTTLMEQLIIFRSVYVQLAAKEITVAASIVDELLTVQEAAGFEMCLARFDEELPELWQSACRTPYFKN